MEQRASGGRHPELEELLRQVVARHRLIVASNRGPVEYFFNEAGMLTARRAVGGVATALSALGQHEEVTWVAAAQGEGDRKAAERAQSGRLRSPLPGQRLFLRFVSVPRANHHKFYNVVCHPLLWFLQHHMWNSPYNPNITAATYDAWESGYVLVNQAFADAAVAEAQGGHQPPLVMVHDYQLYLVPGMVRARLPQALLHHFIHIPWPPPSSWMLLPAPLRSAIFASLCAADVVGFQTLADARSFLLGCATFLPEAQVDYPSRAVCLKGHRTRAEVYPLSVDVDGLGRLARSPRVKELEGKLAPFLGSRTIVRVDQAEPSKNIIRGLRAYELLLERHPELVGEVVYLAFLAPTRASVRQYQRYQAEVTATVEEVNKRFQREGWTPIRVFLERNYPQALAALRLYDVLLVNAVADGMNLVAKEGPLVNTKDGVLVLSEGVGAYEELREGAIAVAPTDVEGTMKALHQALTMAPEERRQWAEALRRQVREHDLEHWLQRQLQDLLVLSQGQAAVQTAAGPPGPEAN